MKLNELANQDDLKRTLKRFEHFYHTLMHEANVHMSQFEAAHPPKDSEDTIFKRMSEFSSEFEDIRFDITNECYEVISQGLKLQEPLAQLSVPAGMQIWKSAANRTELVAALHDLEATIKHYCRQAVAP